MKTLRWRGMLAVILLCASHICIAGESFSDMVGSVDIGPAPGTDTVRVPFIVWGGDIATFHANGGLKTAPGSLFQKQGMNLVLTPGDDFIQQVRDYMEGKSPFLRGTFRMMGMASEVIGKDPRTKGVVLFQMTWSAGDHAVARSRIRTLRDLKGAKVCLQKGGPHEGLLDDLLRDAGLGWNDITPVWVKDLTGTEDSPASRFRAEEDIDVCFVISPDMLGLTSGLQSVGSGLEGTVKGARVLASTAERSRSIADVYVVRKDFFDKNRAWCEAFAVGYLKACEEVVDMRKAYETTGSKPFESLLTLAQSIYGQEVLPTIEEDAYGLIQDCTFVGHPGNVRFFTDPKNLTGFEAFQVTALDLAQTRGYATIRAGLLPSPLQWDAPTFMDALKHTEATTQDRFRAEAVLDEIEALHAGGTLDSQTIHDFSIHFKPNQQEFSTVQYGTEFDKVVRLAAQYGNAVIAIRGHSDPTKILLETIQAGMNKGVLKRTGTSGNYTYYLNGRELNLQATDALVAAIQRGDFDGVSGINPRETLQAALNLSRKRAEEVRTAVLAYAKEHDLPLDTSQIQPVGVGITEPVVPRPTNMAEAEANMRVEFRLLRVRAEVMNESDFDF